jgi:hypothetical protein
MSNFCVLVVINSDPQRGHLPEEATQPSGSMDLIATCRGKGCSRTKTISISDSQAAGAFDWEAIACEGGQDEMHILRFAGFDAAQCWVERNRANLVGKQMYFLSPSIG